MADQIQLRRDLAANWTSVNPLLAQGELGYELDTGKFKVGDGSTLWASLPYRLSTDHTALTNIGTNTHAQIDTHLASTLNPHSTTAAQVGAYTTTQTDTQISNAVTAHTSAGDPHPQYLTPAEGSAAYAPLSHVGAGGTQHSNATTSVAGFMSSADKTKLDAIGGARIIKSGTVAAGSFTGAPRTSTVTFGAAFPNTNYSIAVIGANSRSWSFQTKATTGFVINSNSVTALTGEVLWTCISHGESVE